MVEPSGTGGEVWQGVWNSYTDAIRNGFAEGWVDESKQSDLALLNACALRVAEVSDDIPGVAH